jgi:hypothetical protein
MYSQPKFHIGQRVIYNVTATVAGIQLSKKSEFTIVAVYMSSSTTDRTYTYDLSNDPPGPYHCGGTTFKQTNERDLEAMP